MGIGPYFMPREAAASFVDKITIKTMKMIITSDLHGFLPETPSCDLLLIAGDIIPRREFREEVQKKWLLRYFRPWLDRQPAKQIFFVAGNHDIALEDRAWARSHFPEYLYLQYTQYEGISIFATPYSLHGRPSAFQKETEEIREIFRSIQNTPPDIILSHGPIRGILDSKTGLPLEREVAEIAPQLFVSGHIHDEFGLLARDGTTFVNASLCSSLKIPEHPLWSAKWKEGYLGRIRPVQATSVDSSAVPEKVRYGKIKKMKQAKRS